MKMNDTSYSIKELMQISYKRIPSLPFFTHPYGLGFMSFYDRGNNSKQIDRMILEKFGNRKAPFTKLLPNEEDISVENALIIYQDIISTLIESKANDFQKAYDTINEEYNPLNNYDGTSTTTETHQGDILIKTGTETDTLTKTGTETDTLTKTGTETDTLTKTGTETDTLTKTGTETDTLTKTGTETDTLKKNGSEKDILTKTGTEKNSSSFDSTSTDSVTPWNEPTIFGQPNFVDISQNNTNGHYADNHNELTFENRQDENTKSFVNRQDENTKSFINREDENTKSFSNRQDETTTSFADRQDENVKSFSDRQDETTTSFQNRKDSVDYSVITTETKSGNLGVTSSQKLVEDEYNLRIKMLNFYMDVFSFVIYETTY